MLVATAGTGGIPHRQGNIHPRGNRIAQPGGGPAARTTAYVVSRMGRAMAAAQRGHAIQENLVAQHLPPRWLLWLRGSAVVVP